MECVIVPSRECDGCLACKDESVYCSRCDEKILDVYYDVFGHVLCQQCIDECKVDVDG